MNIRNLLLLPLVLCVLTACGDDPLDDAGTDGGGSQIDRRVLSRMEVPAVNDDGAIVISHWTRENGDSTMTYCLQYDALKYHSKWVAFRFDGVTGKDAKVGRNESWSDDPYLKSAYRIGTAGFGKPYNRGHLCASEDRQYSVTANQQTFFMSNMSPQEGNFNQGYWVTLEGLIQTKGRDRNFADTLYVVKGGTIANGQTMGSILRSNGRYVAVPKYYFVALLRVKEGAYASIAFWMENKDYGYDYDNKAPLSEIRKTAITVNELEEKTGIDFFPNLPDAAEEKIEATMNPSKWGF